MDQTAKRRSLRRSAGKWNRYEPAASDAELDAIGFAMQQRPILPVITLPLWLEYHYTS